MGFLSGLAKSVGGTIFSGKTPWGNIPGLGGSSSDPNQSALNYAQQTYEQQKEFAQNGIRWKVEDAKAAGVHPLFALGANTTSFSPIGVNFQPDTSDSSNFARLGSNISDALHRKSTSAERAQAQINRLNEAQIESVELDNALKASELSRSKQLPPALPSPGYSGEVIPEFRKLQTPYGVVDIPSESYTDLVTEDPIEYIKHYARRWKSSVKRGSRGVYNRLKKNRFVKRIFRKLP
jgi:hypothetical protein